MLTDLNGVFFLADEEHLDTAEVLVIKGLMAEVLPVHCCSIAIFEMSKDVEIKRSRDACTVIVGGMQDIRIFLQIHAQQESPVAADQPTHTSEKVSGFMPFEIADTGTGKETDFSFIAGKRQIEFIGEINTSGMHLKPRIFPGKRFCCISKILPGDVEWCIDGRPKLFEQNSDLGGRATAILNQQKIVPDQFADLSRMLLEHANFSLGQIVFWLLRDLSEEL